MVNQIDKHDRSALLFVFSARTSYVQEYYITPTAACINVDMYVYSLYLIQELLAVVADVVVQLVGYGAHESGAYLLCHPVIFQRTYWINMRVFISIGHSRSAYISEIS